jgi:glycosyltransferase involved in cell wall biosynthesis
VRFVVGGGPDSKSGLGGYGGTTARRGPACTETSQSACGELRVACFMNVLELISSNVGFYGAERVVVTLSAALQEIGVNTVFGVFVNPTKTTHLEILDQAKLHNLKIEEVPCRGRLDRNAILAIRSIVARHKIDIIHCHGTKPNLYAYLAARNSDIALVSTCHPWIINSVKDWLISVLDRCFLHASDRVVLVSGHMNAQVRRFGVRADLIYNGINLEPFLKPTPDLRQEMGWGKRSVIGAVGRLAPEKGHRYLLRAAARVLPDNPDALFVMVGDGPERRHLEAEARALGIQSAVCFLGVRKDIPELLSSLDVLAMPSLSEGMPMALLEAMASGKAVVASKIGAIPHVIQNRLNGILVTPGDVTGLAAALRDLLKNRELRMALGRQARHTVESQFSATSMAKQYLHVYRQMKIFLECAGKPGARIAGIDCGQ